MVLPFCPGTLQHLTTRPNKLKLKGHRGLTTKHTHTHPPEYTPVSSQKQIPQHHLPPNAHLARSNIYPRMTPYPLHSRIRHIRFSRPAFIANIAVTSLLLHRSVVCIPTLYCLSPHSAVLLYINCIVYSTHCSVWLCTHVYFITVLLSTAVHCTLSV